MEYLHRFEEHKIFQYIIMYLIINLLLFTALVLTIRDCLLSFLFSLNILYIDLFTKINREFKVIKLTIFIKLLIYEKKLSFK